MSVTQILSIILFVLGEGCILIALIGVFRFDFVLNRMHATTIADTLGTFFIVLGGLLQFGLSWTSAKLLLVLLFQWITVPIAGHMIARMVFMNDEGHVKEHAEITFPHEEEGSD